MAARGRLVAFAARTVRTVRGWRRARGRGRTGAVAVKRSLTLRQEGGLLSIEAVTGPGLRPTALLARTVDGERIPLADVEPSRVRGDGGSGWRVAAQVDLLDLLRRLEEAGAPAAVAAPDAAGRERTVNLDLAVGGDGGGDGQADVVPLGRFADTTVSALGTVHAPDGTDLTPRVTAHGNVTVVVGPVVSPPIDLRTDEVVAADGAVTIRGVIDTGTEPLRQADLVVSGRHLRLDHVVPLTLTWDAGHTRRRYGLRRYVFSATVAAADLVGGARLDPHAIVDLWVRLAPRPRLDPPRYRVGRLPYELRTHLPETTARLDADTSVTLIPYTTAGRHNLSIIVEQLPAAAQRLIDTPPGRPARNERPVWLLGERPDTAQDNGLHLFRYLRTHRRDIDAFYVLTADSPDRANLAGLDNVIDFGSPTHVEITRRADRIVGTHHADYLYPTRAKAFVAEIDAPRIFLQHGVIAMKWVGRTYAKNSEDFATDVFCVSSEREKRYIVNDLGYDPGQVKVTGLARFDALFTDDVSPRPDQVLVMPTWRPWLADEEAFERSDFLAQWRGLLEDPRLAELRRDRGLTIKFYLHTNMAKYADYFRQSGVDFVHHGDADIQTLLKESAVLVTDFSSPAMDFAFLGKPVVFFQFDRTRLLGKAGGHMDLDTELPGFSGTHVDHIVARLAEVTAPGFETEPEYTRRARVFLARRDRRNCERIVAVVEAARGRRGPIAAITGSDTYRDAGTRLRRSKHYMPLQRRLYRLYQLLPVKRNMIVFESAMGKQFSDSPRAIYDELVRRGDRRRRVWIYHRTPPVDDPLLTVVKRFSPRYFYYLARAKYWVSNQNLPYYITRRRRGVYVQTWHGTPLKRMLYDLDQIVGRDEGYQSRVTTAIAQWSTLLSPSPYATEAFRSAFRYDGPVAELGYPRNDVLLTPDAPALRAQVRAQLGIRGDQRVVLYAPTFRDDQKKGQSFRFELPIDLHRFAAEFGGDTVLLLRTHMLISNNLEIPADATAAVRDVSGYPEIAELYLAADTLVTDYSSVMFDFALTGSPMVFYPYDLATYRDEVRGFYLDYEATVPGPIARSEDELFAALRATAAPTADQLARIRDFATRYAPHDDGRAATRVVDALLAGRRRR